MERKLQASPALKRAYDENIRDHLDKGYLSLAAPETELTKNLPSYYIPHHPVCRENSLTTKVRIVTDASAKTTTSKSLNDILYAGENLQGNIFSILINFRLFEVAISADVH